MEHLGIGELLENFWMVSMTISVGSLKNPHFFNSPRTLTDSDRPARPGDSWGVDCVKQLCEKHLSLAVDEDLCRENHDVSDAPWLIHVKPCYWLVVSNMFYFPFHIWDVTWCHPSYWRTPSFFNQVNSVIRRVNFMELVGVSSLMSGQVPLCHVRSCQLKIPLGWRENLLETSDGCFAP